MQLQADATAQAGQLEAQTQEVRALQKLAAQQHATMVSNTQESQESERRLNQAIARLQVTAALSSDEFWYGD